MLRDTMSAAKCHRKCLVLLIVTVTLLHAVQSSDPQRPFYNIAHMVNSIKEINYYIQRGANAIEADVSFSPNGTALYTFHGYPCDCFRHCTEREDFAKYLEYVREVTRPESPYYKKGLALLFLDLKISSLPPSAKAQAGQDMAAKIVEHLYQGGKAESKIKVLLSIGHIYDSDFILGFQNELESRDMAAIFKDKIGWDVGLNDPISLIVSMWKRIEVIDNIWQGDGRSNCISPFYNLGRLTTALHRRDERNAMIEEPFIDKVYHWTIDLSHNLRASLRTGVDGIITNHPERIVPLFRETEFKGKFRFATQEDSPWQRIQLPEEEKGSPAAPSGTPVQYTWAGSFNDLFSSFAKYMRDFVYLRVPNYHSISKRSLSAADKRLSRQH
ncbi:Dermonecrotic toxin LiSicTox-betaIA1i [Halotydeus destructor]|nr:Dermonecrotic toxin LiSicTox-betaIA1i [Halotydeus destructor]